MKRWMWVLSLLPAGVGVLFAALTINNVITNPVLYVRGNLGALALLGGAILSISAIARFWVQIQKRHQDEIKKLRKQTGEDRRRFLQRLDHELKNPLTAIQAGLTNLTYEPLEGYLADEVSAVKAQVLRISRLVADMRKLAALETTPLEKSVVDVSELLTDIVSAFENQTNYGHQRLTLILPSAPWPLPAVEGDPDLLLLAIHNLLENAAKFSTLEDTIEVRAFDDGSDVVVEVADTGPGIPEAEIDRVWEELYRGKGARGVPGSGLGLPLVRAIFDKHEGAITLRSRPDQGTVFSVRLPTK